MIFNKKANVFYVLNALNVCVCTYAFSSLQYAKIWRSRMLYKSLKSNDYAVTAVYPVSGWYYFPPRDQFCSWSVRFFIIIKVLRRLSGDVLLQGEAGRGTGLAVQI